jgi:uncharacterized protein (DUF2147 family)
VYYDMNRILSLLSFVFLVTSPASPANAASLLGTWAVEPDSKGQVGHVQITPCGARLCGTVVRIFDRAGRPTTTSNLGRRVLRDVRQTGPNSYEDGKIYVPLLRAEFDVDIALSGTRLDLTACNALDICRSQTWRRVQ